MIMETSGKVTLIVIFLMVIVILSYRIIDLGVTLTYLEDDLQSANKKSKILVTFQRSRCLSKEDIPKTLSVIEKNGLIIIDGVGFECKVDNEGNRKLLYYVDPAEGLPSAPSDDQLAPGHWGSVN